jgi:hypothetical protein
MRSVQPCSLVHLTNHAALNPRRLYTIKLLIFKSFNYSCYRQHEISFTYKKELPFGPS